MKKFMATCFAAAFVLAGCSGGAGGGATTGDTIKLGANFELTGAVSSYGSAEYDAVKLAVEEINAAGGINGKQIDLVGLDNKSDAAEVASTAMRLVTKEKVVAMIGPATTGNIKASIPAATEGQIPLIAPSATADDVTEDANGGVQKYVFRICFEDSFQGGVMARFADTSLGAKKAVIIGDNSSDYAKGLAKEFKAVFPGEIVAEESYTDTDTDFSAIITSVKNKDFDVLFIPGYYGQAGLIIKQAREAGITVPIIGADGFDSPELANLAGKSNLNDVYFSAHFSTKSESEKVQNFITNFNAEYGTDPNAFSALAYDGVYMLKQAIEDAGTEDPEKVTEALGNIKGFDGVTGTITVNEKHNAVKSAIVIGLKDGEEDTATEVKA